MSEEAAGTEAEAEAEAEADTYAPLSTGEDGEAADAKAGAEAEAGASVGEEKLAAGVGEMALEAGGGSDNAATSGAEEDEDEVAVAVAVDGEEIPPASPSPAPSPRGSPRPPLPPPSFPTLGDGGRTASYDRLRAYEAARRTADGSKLASSGLYWRSFRELLHSSIEETERAEQIFRGSAESNTSYAVALRAAFNDTLDDGGRPVTDPKKRRKLHEARDRRRAAASAEREGEEEGGISGALEGVKSKLFVPEKAFNREAMDRGMGILTPLVESQGLMADRFAEFATYVQSETVPEISEIREALVYEVGMMEKLGDAIQEELEAAERATKEAWAVYHVEAERSVSFATTDRQRKGAANRSGGASPAPDESFIPNCTDVWLLEMRYRMSVAFLATCWDKSSQELAKLFGALKSTECSRRFRLRELLIAYLNRQERLWLSMPDLVSPVMRDLVDKPLDRESIEEEVQTSIRIRAQGLQREEAARKSAQKEQDRGPGLKGADPSEGNYNLTSPLVSDLLVKANVIEMKKTSNLMSSSLMGSWKTTLAIVTADSFLHLLEIPHSAKLTNGSAPEVAFHSLVPTVHVPNEDSIKAGRVPGGNICKDWFKMLQPADSFALPNCTVSIKEGSKGGSETFEVVERIPAMGMMKGLGGASAKMKAKTTTRKVQLRTVSREETKQWIAAITANK